MKRDKFIIAGSKPWHHADFESRDLSPHHDWTYVSNHDELIAAVSASAPSYIFFLHWNWHVPAEIFLNYECVCFHMTDVPYGRGGTPLQNLIVRGHAETQLSALQMVQEMDAGPVYTKRQLALDGSAREIYGRAAELSWSIIDWMVLDRPVPTEQIGFAEYFERRRPAQSELPVSGPLSAIYNHIRMLDAETYPLAFLDHGIFRLEFTNVAQEDGSLRAECTISIRRESKKK